MPDPSPTPPLVGMFREVTLCVLGSFELFDADPTLVTTVARGLGDVIRKHVPDFPPARAWKGRSALRAMVRDLDDLTPPTGP
jgi:hypothetical protein